VRTFWVLALVSMLAVTSVAVARPLMSRSEAAKVARSSGLRAGDLPGFESSPSSPTPGEDIWGGRRYARCANRKAYGKALADVTSPTFDRASTTQFDAVGSEVEVMPNESLAASDLAIAKSKLGRRCLEREMQRLKPQGVELDRFTMTRLGGFNNGVAYRIKMLVAADDGEIVPIYADVFAWAERQVEGAVFFVSGPAAPTRSDENRVLGIVQTRVDRQVYKDEIF
jgi:hypothetical protein